jgi:hypothetical protein
MGSGPARRQSRPTNSTTTSPPTKRGTTERLRAWHEQATQQGRLTSVDLSAVPADAEQQGSSGLRTTSALLATRVRSDVVSYIDVPTRELDELPPARGNEDDHHDLRGVLRIYFQGWLEELRAVGIWGGGSPPGRRVTGASKRDAGQEKAARARRAA